MSATRKVRRAALREAGKLESGYQLGVKWTRGARGKTRRAKERAKRMAADARAVVELFAAMGGLRWP